MNFEAEFVELCLQTMRKEDYGNKDKRLRHNRAMNRLEALKKKLDTVQAPLVLGRLLDHSDARVRIQACRACMEREIRMEQVPLILRAVILVEPDATLKMAASMLLKQCIED